MCWSLSPVSIKKKKKRGMGYQEKNMDTWRSKYWKKRKKCGYMKVHEKKEKKIAMLSKEFTKRDHTKERSFYFIHHNSYTCTSWSDCMTLQNMWYKYALTFIPYIELHIKPSLEVVWRKGKSNALVRTYTLSDLRESNEELSKVCFENLLKNPKLLDMRSGSDLIQYRLMPQLPKMAW